MTNDKAFFNGRDLKNGLADSLKFEANRKKHKVYIFPELSKLLETIKIEIGLDEKQLVHQFWGENRQFIEGILERNSFTVVGNPTISVNLYVTEDPNRLYLEFHISYQCNDLLSDERSDSVLLLKGDGTFIVEDKQFEALRNLGEELSFKTKDGEEKSQRGNHIFPGCGIIGHRTVEHTVKYKLEE
ncbi:MAG: hypothetical protein WCH01_13560 [Methylococcaceae bacterium]